MDIAQNTDIPLIYTSKGNLPVDSLRYETEWTTDTGYVLFCERWYQADEVVKSNVHTYAFDPFKQLGTEIQQL